MFPRCAASSGPTTEDPQPYDIDEINLIERGNYYGSPNRSRGRFDPRQNVYYNNSAPTIPHTNVAPAVSPLAWVVADLVLVAFAVVVAVTGVRLLRERSLARLDEVDPVRVALVCWPWGKYLGDEGMERGIRACVSSFTRHHVNAKMQKGKTCGDYVNSILAKREALLDGYDEAIMLDPQGLVSEATGENLFVVRDGVVATPSLHSVLGGITRSTVIDLAHEKGMPVEERTITRDELYVADEVFLTGTAAEVTPIREIDRRTIGAGARGPQRALSIFQSAISSGCLPLVFVLFSADVRLSPLVVCNTFIPSIRK